MYWEAVVANDSRFDGTFVLCVKTTGIYCRPTCCARLPLRKNVEFCTSPIDAEALGYRACKRCRPKLANDADTQMKLLVRACEVINSDKEILLDDLAIELNMSPSHL